jgi:arylsulfatase A-like enzyme
VLAYWNTPGRLVAPGVWSRDGAITCSLGCKFDGHAILPMEGRSLLPALRGEPPQPRTLCGEHEGNRAVREGDWKLVALGDGPWELDHVAADRTELRNLASQQTDLVTRLAKAWDDWADRCQVRRNQRIQPGERP